MSVKLREKKLANGQVSLYLDIYHDQRRWYEFLEIRLNGKKPSKEDTEKKKLALEIKTRREHELIVSSHGLTDRKSRKLDFVEFFEKYIKEKKQNFRLSSTLYQLREFVGNNPLPVHKVTAEWMKDFEETLLEKVSTNTALAYLFTINSALNELVRQQIIQRNPWHSVPKHERLKCKDTIRTAWTINQLRQLAETPCKINPQHKQAFLFSCLTGLRWSDLNKLEWSNVVQKSIHNKTEWFIYFEQKKTSAVEYFPLSDQAISILKERQETNEDSPYVFPQVKEVKGIRVYSRVRYALKKWAKAAGIDKRKMKFHTGRHTYATNLLEATNGDLYTVSKLLGHKNIQTTQIYAHVRDKAKFTAVKSLPMLSSPAIT